jgi:hypothetical protein
MIFLLFLRLATPNIWHYKRYQKYSGGILHHRREVCIDNYAAASCDKCSLSCQLWMTSRLLFKLYFNNSSRIPTQESCWCLFLLLNPPLNSRTQRENAITEFEKRTKKDFNKPQIENLLLLEKKSLTVCRSVKGNSNENIFKQSRKLLTIRLF